VDRNDPKGLEKPVGVKAECVALVELERIAWAGFNIDAHYIKARTIVSLGRSARAAEQVQEARSTHARHRRSDAVSDMYVSRRCAEPFAVARRVEAKWSCAETAAIASFRVHADSIVRCCPSHLPTGWHL
jgi:hypothetical protein